MAFPDDGIRREIVGGEVYELSAPNVRHRGRYGKPEIIEPGEPLTTPTLPGLVIDVGELLAR